MCHRLVKYCIVLAASILSTACAAQSYLEIFQKPTIISSRSPEVVYGTTTFYHQAPPIRQRRGPPPVVIYEVPAVIYEEPIIIYEAPTRLPIPDFFPPLW